MRETVLIVDDSLTVRMDVAEAFEVADFCTLPCATVAEARAILSREPVKIVILDVILPDGDGVQLLKEIRSRPDGETIVVIMLSTEAEVRHRIRALRTGADEYVGKPYDTGYLVAKVEELIGARSSSSTDDKTILVIDDSATFSEHLRETFEGAGYKVFLAASGEEGLRVAAGLRPSAIVVDGVLPGIDGPTVIRRIRLDAALRDVPCLLLTASEQAGDEPRALDAGADAFVRKDEDAAIILAKVAAVLRRTATARGANDTISMLGPKRILAVDDSVTYLFMLAGVLREEGYDVVLARSGEEALDLLAFQGVDCILLDLLMPGLGGQETCRRIKAAPITRDIPLVMLTAQEEREAMIHGLGAGADDYIQKSSDWEVLKARVRAQLRRKQFEDENRRIREVLLERELEAANAEAARAVAETREALVGELELRVVQRTADLARVNADLVEQIDERKRTEAALRATEEQFRQAQKMEAVGRLAGGIAHDFNNLLVVILSTTELMQEELPAQSPLRQDLSQIEEAATRAAALTKQLLAFSRKQMLEPKVLDLNVVLHGMDRMLRRLISEDIEIVMAAEPALGHVLADVGQIEQVILNLVVNSRDAMPRGGKITLETGNVVLDEAYTREHGGATPGPHVMLAVSDTGHGMDPATRARIFEPFFTTRGLGKGTGLGLSTVYGIVKQSGGNVFVYSEPGGGTTFKIYLPEVDYELSRPAVENPVSSQGGSETVLLVEDDAMVRAVARRILSLGGYEVLEADSADAAVGLCQQHPTGIDLLLTDVVLPGVNGRELANRLGALRPAMKVLFMSGYTDNAIVHHGVLDAGTHFIEKPFTPSTLSRKVRLVLDG